VKELVRVSLWAETVCTAWVRTRASLEVERSTHSKRFDTRYGVRVGQWSINVGASNSPYERLFQCLGESWKGPCAPMGVHLTSQQCRSGSIVPRVPVMGCPSFSSADSAVTTPHDASPPGVARHRRRRRLAPSLSTNNRWTDADTVFRSTGRIPEPRRPSRRPCARRSGRRAGRRRRTTRRHGRAAVSSLISNSSKERGTP
jgi:hypothetical protein